VQLSPDGKTLYAVNAPNIDAFDVAPDGTLSNQRRFADVDGDGMAVDEKGRLYVGLESGTGVQVLAPDGKKLGFIAGPDKFGSVAFGGPDRRSLFILSRGKIYRIHMLTAGVRTRLK
jgi:gluconolactonase